MSGAKVVRIITKQEMRAICCSRIDAVQDMLEQWKKLASRHDVLTIAKLEAAESKLLSLEKLFEREQYVAVQKQCAVEVTALREEMNRIREEAITKTQLERSVRRRLQYSAETLIKTFELSHRQIPEELANIPSSVITANESDLAVISSTLSRILTEYTLSAVEKQAMTPLQKELSEKLAEGERLQTLSDWKIRHGKEIKAVEADRRLDKLLAEIETIESKEAAQPFLDRVSTIANESSPGRRSLLTDSLIFDLCAYLNERKIEEQSITAMRDIRCELRGLPSKSAKDLEALLSKAIDSEDVISGKFLVDRAVGVLKAERKAMAGTSRREAILKALSELGYEIRENMATAWAEDGRIVVRKPNEKGYGIELGAIEDAERVQAQLVSFEQLGSTSSQDYDRETIWCSEFSRLKSLIEKTGTIMHIEKDLPLGAKPLKQVQETSTIQGRERRSKDSVLKKKMHE